MSDTLLNPDYKFTIKDSEREFSTIEIIVEHKSGLRYSMMAPKTSYEKDPDKFKKDAVTQLQTLIEEQGDKCITCKAFAPVDNMKGECHLNPPIFMKTIEHLDLYEREWPILDNLDWCLQHKEK
jgi:hypothetical protein